MEGWDSVIPGFPSARVESQQPKDPQLISRTSWDGNGLMGIMEVLSSPWLFEDSTSIDGTDYNSTHPMVAGCQSQQPTNLFRVKDDLGEAIGARMGLLRYVRQPHCL